MGDWCTKHLGPDRRSTPHDETRAAPHVHASSGSGREALVFKRLSSVVSKIN